MPKWLTEIRGQVPLGAAIALGMIPVVVMVVLWFALTAGAVEERVLGPGVLPSPGEFAEKLPDLFKRNLWTNTWMSFRRVGLGYLIALSIALPLGILMGAFGSVRCTFGPVMAASGYIPLATLAPLTMAWWGIGEKTKVLFLAMAFAIYLVPLVLKSVDGVSDVFLRTAYTLGATKAQAIRRVLIPVALPDIWHGMRLGFGIGWTYLVVAEVYSGVIEEGLGALIGVSQRRGQKEHMYMVIILITLIAWILDMAWAKAGDRLFPYKRRQA